MLTTEEFADIPGYEREYQISNFGNIISLKKGFPRQIKPMVATNGYLVACLWKNGKQSKNLVHRLVAEAFLLPCEGCSEINHIDENKQNNRADNLEWCSHSYNMNYGNVRKKISLAKTGRPYSEALRKKQSVDTSNRRWITDGTSEKFISYESLGGFLSTGWRVGRLHRRIKNV